MIAVMRSGIAVELELIDINKQLIVAQHELEDLQTEVSQAEWLVETLEQVREDLKKELELIDDSYGRSNDGH